VVKGLEVRPDLQPAARKLWCGGRLGIKEKEMLRHIFLLAGLLLMLCNCSYSAGPFKDNSVASELPSYTWTAEKWTGDDKPYVRLRHLIDAQVAPRKGKPQMLAVLVESYKGTALRKPGDPQAQFAWGYALLQSARAGYPVPSGVSSGAPRDVALAMVAAPSPHSYQYARQLLLMAMWWRNYPFPQLTNVSQRLLKRNPKDYAVMYQAAMLLAQSPKLAQRQQAVRYAEQFAKAHPGTAPSYNVVSFTYWCLSDLDKNPAHVDKAIAIAREAYKKFPRTGQAKVESDDYIRTLERRRDRLRKQS